MKKLFFASTIFAILIYCDTSFSQTSKLIFGVKYQIKNINIEYVNDVPNHKMGVAFGTGLAFMRDGSSANVSVYFVFDYTEGNGNFIENYVIQMADSSKISIKAEGTSFGSVDEPMFNATVTIMGGTGEYAGIKGKGKMSGNRRSQLDDKAMVNLSFELEYTLKN
jgi:hypothetical protein